jgi:hypothetical protein
MQGGEGIIRHLRTRSRHRTDESGFTRVGHAQQPHIRQHLEFHLEVFFLARFTRRTLARRTVGARLEMHVTQTAIAALGNQRLLAVLGQVGNGFAGIQVSYHRADRHAQHDVFTALAIAFAALPISATLGAMDSGIAIVNQGIDVAISDGIHAAATPAIATARAALGDGFLTPKGSHAVAAVTGKDLNGCFVDEFHFLVVSCQLSVFKKGATLPHTLTLKTDS